MKKVAFFFIIISIVLLNFQSAKQPEEIKVTYLKNYQPYSWEDKNGIANGLLIDWWKIWAEKAGASIEFIPGTIDECINHVTDKKADVLAGLYMDLDSTKNLLFSEYILRLKTNLFLKKGLKPKSIHELKEPIGVIEGEMTHRIMSNKYPDVSLKLFSSYEELAESVDANEVAGFVYDIPNPLSTDLEEIIIPGYYSYLEIHHDKIRPAILKGNETLLELLLTGSALITDEELISIAKEHHIYKVGKGQLNWFYMGGISLFFITISLILISRKYKKQYQSTGHATRTNNLKDLIENGEGNKLEFKSSLRWDYHQEKVNKDLEKVIAKTIAAFLNTDGGTLMIGINDNGEILGLEKDFMSMSKKNSDGFLLALTNMINEHLGKKCHKFINANIKTIDGKEICLVQMDKSDSPVFLGKKGNEEFFIRASASSQPMSMSETFEYIKSHWES